MSSGESYRAVQQLQGPKDLRPSKNKIANEWMNNYKTGQDNRREIMKSIIKDEKKSNWMDELIKWQMEKKEWNSINENIMKRVND